MIPSLRANEALPDLRITGEILGWVDSFRNWMAQANEEVPLGACGMTHSRTQVKKEGLGKVDIELLYLPARRLNPGFPTNLSLGVFWTPDGSEPPSHGYRLQVLTEKPFHLCVAAVSKDPRAETDVAWSMDWDVLTHEVIHYQDRVSGVDGAMDRAEVWARERGREFVPPGAPERGLVAHFNSPAEYNAYFRQALASFLKTMAFAIADGKADAFAQESLGSFDAFRARFSEGLRYEFTKHASAETDRRMTRRLFRLFETVTSHWPEVPVVERLAKQYSDAWAQAGVRDGLSVAAPEPASEATQFRP